MPQPGHFILHSSVRTFLPAGAYTAHIGQTITAPDAAVAPLDAHFEVTAPRFAMPADQILSTFPPNQSEGSYSSRLAQIVLRRRTLPWERRIDDAGSPWLALVLLADAEAEVKSSLPIAQCVTPGVTISGRSDVAVGDAIVVTDRVVKQVFPTAQELPFLTHVREVDLDDTELALGDDDGWLAVVLSNRLPQPGVRYRACLISLEGQLDKLPAQTDVVDEFDSIFVYADAALNADLLTAYYSAVPDDAAVANVAFAHEVIAAAPSEGAAQVERSLPVASAGVKARAVTERDAWSTPGGVSANAVSFAPAAQTATLIGDMHGIGMHFIDPGAQLYTFPLLAHWTFTCTDGGDFESLMRAIDVGMLGTMPPAPPTPEPGRKPPPPTSRPDPELLDTGHVALEHTTRGGEPTCVWYRGPLVPRPVTRTEPDEHGLLALLHTSDQARRVGPDGRENLALAVAFEIGRLLALAEPSVVAALLTWRKEGYDAARRGVMIALDPELGPVLDANVGHGLAARAGNGLIVSLGAQGAARLGPPRPPIAAGRPIDAIDGAEPLKTLAAGFAMPEELLAELAKPRPLRKLGGVPLPVVKQVMDLDALAEVASRELAGLRAATADTAAQLAADTLGGNQPAPGLAAAERGRDALDELLAALEQEAER
jgi:hypothetical protein